MTKFSLKNPLFQPYSNALPIQTSPNYISHPPAPTQLILQGQLQKPMRLINHMLPDLQLRTNAFNLPHTLSLSHLSMIPEPQMPLNFVVSLVRQSIINVRAHELG